MNHSHSLDNLAGYVVVKTLGAPEWPARGVVLTKVIPANEYAVALEIARSVRKDGSYAVVETLHGCPCDEAKLAGLRP